MAVGVGGVLIVEGAGAALNAAHGAGSILATFSARFSSDKKERQAKSRGWTEDLVNNLLENPTETASTIHRKTGNSATVYYNSDGNYVVVDDVTDEIFHMSDRNDPEWWDPFGQQKKSHE